MLKKTVFFDVNIKLLNVSFCYEFIILFYNLRIYFTYSFMMGGPRVGAGNLAGKI